MYIMCCVCIASERVKARSGLHSTLVPPPIMMIITITATSFALGGNRWSVVGGGVVGAKIQMPGCMVFATPEV